MHNKETSDIEKRVAEIESRLRRMQRTSLIKNIIYVIIVIGVALYVYKLYTTSHGWRAELVDVPRIGLASPTQLRISLLVKIYNPSGEQVLARLVYYKVYIQGYYAGDGLIPYLALPPGWSEHRLTLVLDVDKAGCGIAKALATRRNVTVTLQGFAMVDLKAFNTITWKIVTLPFNITVANVNVPKLSSQAAAILQLYTLVCDEAPRLVTALTKLLGHAGLLGILSQGGQSGTHGTSTGGGASQGQEASQPPVKVTVTLEKSGLASYTAIINITNVASHPVSLEKVAVNGRSIAEGKLPQVLLPGQALTLKTSVPSPMLLIKVTVDGKTYTYIKS
ncbi:hypothetical protein CF15_03025 [Pyrodictium occultum]|uniref:Late embryogenesis abundant protein LEA-2 subgroup domain-containing protein n=1 Tax=Pyrodictium occultum TaxID=2309 RepID=A0A0V8RUS0_PYROC|nr:hypothetical protein CF15_03025 [Pyrodictium occultum]